MACHRRYKTMLTMVPRALWWLLAGGLCYTGGVLFYVRENMRYHHVPVASFCPFR